MVHASPVLDLPSHDCVPVLPLEVSAYQIYSPFYTGMGIRDWRCHQYRAQAAALCCESLCVYGGLQSFLGQT